MKSVVCAALVLSAVIVSIGSFFFAAPFTRGATNISSSLTMGNAAPTVPTVSVNNGNSITLTPATTTNVSVAAQIVDNNGCGDLTAGTTTILLYRSGVGSSTCLTTPSNLNCYIATAFTASSTCTGVQTSINTTTTIPVQYYAQATDSSSSFLGQNWMATVIFTDPSAAQGSGDSSSASSTADLLTLVGMSLSTTTINYGTLTASSDTSSTNQQVTVLNVGNSNLSVSVNGTALSASSSTLATSSQHFATSSFTFGGGEQQLSDSATTVSGMLIYPSGTTASAGSLSAAWAGTQKLPLVDHAQSVVAYNGYVYNIGGEFVASVGGTTSTILFAQPNGDGTISSWATTQALPFVLKQGAAAAYNGYLYSISGLSGLNLTSTVVFAPINSTGSLGAWTNTSALPVALNLHAAVAYNGFLYTIGGTSSADTSTVLFAQINATGSLGAWARTQALPYSDSGPGVAAYNGFLYVFGGVGANAATSTVIFAPINSTGSIGAWTKTQALPFTETTFGSAAYNGFLYAVSGLASSTNSTTVLFAPINATGSVGAWTSTQALPSALTTQGVVASNGYIYSLGGQNNGGTITSTVNFAPLVGVSVSTTYWGVAAPGMALSGNYSGITTFTAAFSQ